MKLKIFLFLFILVFGLGFSQSKTDLIEVENINKYSEIINKDSKITKHQFQVKGKNKTILYHYEKNGNEIVKISREWKENRDNYMDTFTDYFLLKNEERIFASQSIVYTNKSDSEDMGGWSCSFWINRNKVIHMTSLGHGKTELDDWDYELELKDNFNFMLKTVQNYDKNRKAINNK